MTIGVSVGMYVALLLWWMAHKIISHMLVLDRDEFFFAPNPLPQRPKVYSFPFWDYCMQENLWFDRNILMGRSVLHTFERDG